MKRRGRTIRDLADDDRGVAMVEYTLLLAVFVLPLFPLFVAMLSALTQYYRLLTFLHILPLP
ncbi:MAG: hypothetical protein ACLFUJ_05750 [Phycisphaerae bacterium]